MITANQSARSHLNHAASLGRIAVHGESPDVLTDIYRPDVNLSVWQRELSKPLQQAVTALLSKQSVTKTVLSLSPDSALKSIKDAFGPALDDRVCYDALAEDIAEIVDMFCCLFGLKRAGLRLSAPTKAMCPRFHVDRVPCRLITTYYGEATEWLPNETVNRAKLGKGSQGLNDCQSGLLTGSSGIQQLKSGDIALLKGESWEGNENAGLVHRSPAVAANEKRLLLTLDFSD